MIDTPSLEPDNKNKDSTQQLPLFFGINDLIHILGVSRTTAYALVHTKGFPCGRIGARIVIERGQFMDWVQKSFNNQPIVLLKNRGKRRSA